MAQASYTIENDFSAQVRANINATFQAVKSNNSGPTAPENAVKYQTWFNTTNDIEHIYDGNNWVERLPAFSGSVIIDEDSLYPILPRVLKGGDNVRLVGDDTNKTVTVEIDQYEPTQSKLYEFVNPIIQAGDGISITRTESTKSITITNTGGSGGSGLTPGSYVAVPITTQQRNLNGLVPVGQSTDEGKVLTLTGNDAYAWEPIPKDLSETSRTLRRRTILGNNDVSWWDWLNEQKRFRIRLPIGSALKQPYLTSGALISWSGGSIQVTNASSSSDGTNQLIVGNGELSGNLPTLNNNAPITFRVFIPDVENLPTVIFNPDFSPPTALTKTAQLPRSNINEVSEYFQMGNGRLGTAAPGLYTRHAGNWVNISKTKFHLGSFSNSSRIIANTYNNTGITIPTMDDDDILIFSFNRLVISTENTLDLSPDFIFRWGYFKDLPFGTTSQTLSNISTAARIYDRDNQPILAIRLERNTNRVLIACTHAINVNNRLQFTLYRQ